MAEYRVPEFTLEQRAEAAVQMLVPLPDREWGPVSERARLYGVSRTLLYEIRDRALEAVVEETKAIELFDNWCWLLGEARLSLEPITPTYHIVSVADTKATMTTAVELLKELDHPAITTFAEDLQEKLPELLAPLEWLEQQLTPVLKNLDAEAQAVILWAWQHRQELNLNIDTDIPQKPRSVVRTAWDILGLFHRSSSLAESLHSWLRPCLQIHRGMPKWLLPLLQLFWNHHRFERGKRAGSSPLELAGVEDAPSLTAVLDRLFCPGQSAQPA